MDIYPLTIVKDRFNGTYSGGKFVAWNCQPCSIPSDTYSRKVCGFWETIHSFEDDTETPYPTYGVGNTIEEAIENLKNKLDSEEEKIELKIKTPYSSCSSWRKDWNRCGDYIRSSDCITWLNWYSTTYK